MFFSPKTSADGLVFHYDTGNTVRSYLGEPTTNLAAGLGLTDLGAGLSFIGVEDGWLKYSMSATWSGGGYPYSIALNSVSFTGGQPYSVVAILRTNVENKFNYFCTNGISYVNQPKDYEGTLSATLNPDGSRIVRRVNFAYTSTTGQLGYLFTNPINGITFNPATDFVYLKAFQAEQKPHPTPFTTGTRSATQGLKDLTAVNTIDLSSVSFDSNAQMVFDGSNDYISLADGTKWFTNEWTYEMVLKFNGNTGTYQGLLWGEGDTGGGSGLQKLFTFYDYSYFHYRINNAVTGWTQTDFTPTGFTPTKYNHLAWQFNNGVTNLYINGALAHTNNVRGAYSGGTNSPLYIGCRNDVAYVFNGEMPMLKRYSRALTADEVARNFNAVKSRFNIA